MNDAGLLAAWLVSGWRAGRRLAAVLIRCRLAGWRWLRLCRLRVRRLRGWLRWWMRAGRHQKNRKPVLFAQAGGRAMGEGRGTFGARHPPIYIIPPRKFFICPQDLKEKCMTEFLAFVGAALLVWGINTLVWMRQHPQAALIHIHRKNRK